VLFDDELFIRTPSEMRPTERVDELAVELGDILASIERIIYPEITFDPRSFEGEVIIGTSDYAAWSFFHTLLHALSDSHQNTFIYKMS